VFDNPSEGRVSEPDRRRLFLSDMTADDANDAACLRAGRCGLAPGTTAEVGVRLGCNRTSRPERPNCSTGVSSLGCGWVCPKGDPYRWAASCMLEGKVPALALLKPVGKLVGGRLSTVELAALSAEGGGESPEVMVRSAGGR
jgi:hypothetical protein